MHGTGNVTLEQSSSDGIHYRVCSRLPALPADIGPYSLHPRVRYDIAVFLDAVPMSIIVALQADTLWQARYTHRATKPDVAPITMDIFGSTDRMRVVPASPTLSALAQSSTLRGSSALIRIACEHEFEQCTHFATLSIPNPCLS